MYRSGTVLQHIHIGGFQDDNGYAIAVDSAGNVYVTGGTNSYDFPSVNPGHGYASNTDVFISKLTNSGHSLMFSTFIGGNADESGYAIAIDHQGYAYVTGITTSADLPIVNGFDSSYAGSSDAFAAKISPEGNLLVYSTYLGGFGYDIGRGIAVSDNGNAIITGFTLSQDFPTYNAYDSVFNGGSVDAFIAKLTSQTGLLEFSTFFGGTGSDYSFGVALNDSSDIYITGPTSSPDLPILNPFQYTLNGPGDIFISKFNPSASALIYSTYLGGSSGEQSLAIAVDNVGNAYVTGFTGSYDFPVINAFDSTRNSDYLDAFVTKITGGDTIDIDYSTFLGGDYDDEGWGIAVDGFGCAYVTGHAFSTNFPVLNAYDSTLNGNDDVFVTQFLPSGDSLRYSTYLGGQGYDIGRGIVVDATGNATVAGYTSSLNFPVFHAYDSTFNGGNEVFVARFCPVTNIDDQSMEKPEYFQLDQNYPNPFNMLTVIRYTLRKQAAVDIDIFDILGRKVESLTRKVEPAGQYQIIWNADGQTSGIYFYRLRTQDDVEIRKMVLIK